MKIDSQKYVLSIDLGTSGVKASIWDLNGRMVNVRTIKVPRIVTDNGFIEQDPVLLLNKQLKAVKLVLQESRINPVELASIGIANQRESVVAWNKDTGRPLYNVISWMDRRTSFGPSSETAELRSYVKERTGLLLDPYFSAPKMAWLVEHIREKYGGGLDSFLKLGTLDSWIVWKLTSGKSYVTDWSNASRTMLFDFHRGTWDSRLLENFKLQEDLLPNVVDSVNPGVTTDRSILGSEIEIGGIAGDQQASLFGHLALNVGEMKSTYGTGSFILVNAGGQVPKTDRLISTIAWKERGKKPVYAVEGNAFSTGSLMEWAKNNLNIINRFSDSERFAIKAKAEHGLYFVPALEGLGAPYWNRDVRAGLMGLTSVTTRAEIVRAILESIAYITRDIIEQIRKETGLKPRELRVDGKLSSNGFLMQFLSDLIGVPLHVSRNTEMTSAGAAFLAIKASRELNVRRLKEELSGVKEVKPTINRGEVQSHYEGWKRAVQAMMNVYA